MQPQLPSSLNFQAVSDALVRILVGYLPTVLYFFAAVVAVYLFSAGWKELKAHHQPKRR